MTGETVAQTVYFKVPGQGNTQRTLELAYSRVRELGLTTVLVATTSGATAVQATQLFKGCEVIAVTHSAGFSEPGGQELTPEYRAVMEQTGTRILTCQHAFGGVGRAIRKQLGTYQLDEIIAYTLRLFGQGLKVAVEIALMAADAGVVGTSDPVMVVAGTGKGADTAVVLQPANAQALFDLKILEWVCLPSPSHPAFRE